MGIKLKEWLKYNHSDEEMSIVFYNMSKTMKYIHERNYYIKTFNLNEIEIENLENLNPIIYNTVVKAPMEYSDEIQREDIYNLAFMQIGIYTDTLNNLNPKFLKEQFDSFIPLLPEKDVAYFRGTVVNGARVYYSDYVEEKNKREIEKIADISEGSERGRSIVKTNSAGKYFSEKDMKNLYSEINRPDAAFVNLLLYPLLILTLGLIISIVFFLS